VSHKQGNKGTLRCNTTQDYLLVEAGVATAEVPTIRDEVLILTIIRHCSVVGVFGDMPSCLLSGSSRLPGVTGLSGPTMFEMKRYFLQIFKKFG
jgi:hypothetical protein